MQSVRYSYAITKNGYPASTSKKPAPAAMPLWVEVLIPATKKEITHLMGRKCKSYEKECCLCEAWKQWEKDGRMPMLFERTELLKL